MNGKCSKILNTFLFLFSTKMLVIMAGIHKTHVSIANSGDANQTALGLHCLSRHFCQATSAQNFRTFTVSQLISLNNFKRRVGYPKSQALFQTSLFCTKREYCQFHGSQSDRPGHTQTSLLSYRD